AMRVPGHLKVNGWTRKRVLKRAAADLLPTWATRRRKRGFGVPLAQWFGADLAPYIASTLGSPRARVKQYVNVDAADDLLRQRAAGGAPLFGWPLLRLGFFWGERMGGLGQGHATMSHAAPPAARTVCRCRASTDRLLGLVRANGVTRASPATIPLY